MLAPRPDITTGQAACNGGLTALTTGGLVLAKREGV
jgi:hypothetical protein